MYDTRGRRLVLAWVAVIALSGLAGCVHRTGPLDAGPVDGRYRTVPRVMWMPDTAIGREARHVAREIGSAPYGEHNTVIARAQRVVESGEFGPAAWLMTDGVLRWAIRLGHQRDVLPLVRQCLAHEDRLVRWAGIVVAKKLGYEQTMYAALVENYASLLIRPEPEPWWTVPPDPGYPVFPRYRNSDTALARACRGQVLALLGEYGVQEAEPVLQAIVADRWDRDARTKAAAALERLAEWRAAEPGELEARLRQLRSDDDVQNKPWDRSRSLIVE